MSQLWDQTIVSETKKKKSTIKCPTCETAVEQDNATFPFCSKQCQMVDLNKWFGGDYKISRPIEQADLDEV